MPRGDFGNTFDFAARMMRKHWDRDHEGQPPGPYDCQVCRDLWLRASNAVDSSRPTPYRYEVVVAWARTGKASTLRQ